MGPEKEEIHLYKPFVNIRMKMLYDFAKGLVDQEDEENRRKIVNETPYASGM
jgi:hypothetical protein